MTLNAQARALRRIEGLDSYAPNILAPAAQSYVIDSNVPVQCSIITFTAFMSAGTCTAALQVKLPGGSFVTVAGLSALALTTVAQTFTATADGTEYMTPGSQLQLVITSPSGAANLAGSIAVQRN